MPPARSLSDRAASGVVWLVAQTAATKGVSLVGTLVLAALLAPEAFGLVALANTFAAFAGLLRQGGVLHVLVQRQKKFDLWATPGTWISAATGIGSGLLLAASAPLAVMLYGENALLVLILVLALEAPFAAIATTAQARAQIDMRFGLLARVNTAVIVVQWALSIVLAVLGAGALAFVAPRPVVGALRAAVLWAATRPRVKPQPMFRRWKYMLGQSVFVVLAMVAYQSTQQGAAFLLGRLFGAVVAGYYFFAFNLAMQALALFSTGLQQVLLPALSKMSDEPARQLAAAERAGRTLALLTVPFCVGQALAAGPAIRLVFGDKWAPSATMLGVLSLAMAIRTVSPIAGSLIVASGRYRRYFLVHLASAALYFPVVIAGARWGMGDGAALGVLAHAMLAHVVFFRVAGGAGWIARSLSVLRPGLAAGGTGAGAMLLVEAGAAEVFHAPALTPAGDILRLVLLALVWTPVTVCVTAVADRVATAELLDRVAGVLPGRARLAAERLRARLSVA